ncbi:hypothetical protein D3C73_1443390 [compost metagenome]
MGFDVGLGHHKQAVDIAQLIEARIVRVMRGTHRVNVVLLHQQQIFFDPIHSDRAAFQMIVIVAVNTVQHYVVVVDVKQPVADRNVAESDALRNHLNNIAAGIF